MVPRAMAALWPPLRSDRPPSTFAIGVGYRGVLVAAVAGLVVVKNELVGMPCGAAADCVVVSEETVCMGRGVVGTRVLVGDVDCGWDCGWDVDAGRVVSTLVVVVFGDPPTGLRAFVIDDVGKIAVSEAGGPAGCCLIGVVSLEPDGCDAIEEGASSIVVVVVADVEEDVVVEVVGASLLLAIGVGIVEVGSVVSSDSVVAGSLGKGETGSTSVGTVSGGPLLFPSGPGGPLSLGPLIRPPMKSFPALPNSSGMSSKPSARSLGFGNFGSSSRGNHIAAFHKTAAKGSDVSLHARVN